MTKYYSGKRITVLLFLVLMALLFYTQVRFKESPRNDGVTVQLPSNVSEEAKQNSARSRQPLLLFVGIYSAPRHLDRRNAVRETWMSLCKNKTKHTLCLFITDGQDVKGKSLQGPIREKLENESRMYGDLLLAQSPGGVNFARRYVWMIQWASERYDFQYLLRVDDDYFICFERLLMEMRFHRPRQKLYWGWLHCSMKGAVAIDEGFVIVTKDIISLILDRVSTDLPCHPYGGQALGMWLKDVPSLQAFGDNKRLFHLRFDSKEKAAKRNEICSTALGVHQSYPKEMMIYWKVYQNETVTKYPVPPIAFPCGFPLGIDHKVFGGKWFAEPKPCKDNPVWDRGEYFKGRTG